MCMTQDDSNDETFKEFTRSYSEEGLATLLIVIGAILFIFPEPITTVTGVVVLIAGVATWFTDWLWG